MTNHNTLFYNIMKFIRFGHHAFHDLRVLQTFVWAVVGVIESKKPHFSHWLPFRPGRAKAASKERQFSRWLHNDKVRPMLIYQPFVKQVMADWADETACLALDTTQLWKRFVIIRLALVYCGRAIPLGWVVCASGSATVAVPRYQRMLAQVAAQIPTTTKVILLADRGFSHIDLMKIATQLGWHFRVRLKSDTLIHLADGTHTQVKRLMPPVGKGCFYAYVWITLDRGRCHCLWFATGGGYALAARAQLSANRLALVQTCHCQPKMAAFFPVAAIYSRSGTSHCFLETVLQACV